MTFEELKKTDFANIPLKDFQRFSGGSGFSCREMAIQKILQHTKTNPKQTMALISDVVENYPPYVEFTDAYVGVVISQRQTKNKRAGAHRKLTDPDGCGTLTFYPRGMNVCTILHEIAHLIEPRAKHGIVWKQAYMILVNWACERYQFTPNAKMIIETDAILCDKVYTAQRKRRVVRRRSSKRFFRGSTQRWELAPEQYSGDYPGL